MGQLKSQSQPNNIIKCKYEIEEEEKNQAINVITEDEVEINKINIYYVKKFNNGVKKRIRIGRKQKFSEKSFDIIIIVDKSISIKSLKGLFKGCKHLKDINDKFLVFPGITKDNLLEGSNLDKSVKHSPEEKPENRHSQKKDNEIQNQNNENMILEENKFKEEKKVEKNKNSNTITEIADLLDKSI